MHHNATPSASPLEHGPFAALIDTLARVPLSLLLVLIGAGFCLAAAVPLYFLYQQSDQAIIRAKQELTGLEALMPFAALAYQPLQMGEHPTLPPLPTGGETAYATLVKDAASTVSPMQFQQDLQAQLHELRGSHGLTLDPDAESSALNALLFQTLPQLWYSTRFETEYDVEKLRGTLRSYVAKAQAGSSRSVAREHFLQTLQPLLHAEENTDERLAAQLNALTREGRDVLAGMLHERIEAQTAKLNLSIGIIVACFAGVALLVIGLGAALYRDLHHIGVQTARAGSGDLSVRYAACQWRSFRFMRALFGQLDGLIGVLREYHQSLHGASGIISARVQELQDQSDQLFERSMAQIRNTEQIVSVIETLLTDIEGLREFTNASVNATEGMIAKVSDTEGVLETSAAHNREIDHSLRAANCSVQEVIERTRSVSDIGAFIRKIARDITLVALNASIEAARAGEAGRAFSVVAENVSGLAQAITDRTGEIENIIRSTITSVDENRRMLDQINAHSANAIGRLEESRRSMSDSINAARSVQENAAKTRTRSQESEEAARHLATHARSTAQDVLEDCNLNTQLAQRSAHSVHALNDALTHLNQLLSRFHAPSAHVAMATLATAGAVKVSSVDLF